MASRDSSPGQGFYLNLLGKSSLPAVLAGFAQQTADLRNQVVIIGPAEVPGWFFVRNLCSDQAYRVQSLNGVNYAPGTMVILGNQGSGKGGPEFIIGSVGQAGGSEVSVSTSVTFGTFPVVTPPPATPPCAIQIPNHRYLGIIRANSDNTLYPYGYLDGTIGALLGPSWNPGTSDSLVAGFPAIRIHPRDLVVLQVQAIGLGPPYHFQIATWDIAAGTQAVLDTGIVYGGSLTAPVASQLAWRPGTNELHFIIWTFDLPSDSYFGQVYRTAVGASGSGGATALGTPFQQSFGLVTWPPTICGNVLAVAGGRFDLGTHLWTAAPADNIGGGGASFNSDGSLACAWCNPQGGNLSAGAASADGTAVIQYFPDFGGGPSHPSYFLRVIPPARFGTGLIPPCPPVSVSGTLVQQDGAGDPPVAFLARD